MANIPSSIVVTRVGAPVWLALLMLCWGVVSACTAAVRTRAQFYAIRVLLGITEAGCFPGAPAPPGPRPPRDPAAVLCVGLCQAGWGACRQRWYECWCLCS